MSNLIDREGIFLARPVSWMVRQFKDSSAVAVNIEFEMDAMLNPDNEWDDWTEYGYGCYGSFFVTKKNGAVNTVTVEQLAKSMGWDGDLRAVATQRPPNCRVQITVKEDTYNGKTSYKATWMNPEDFVPTPGGASEEEVSALQNRFGSLLRAAASGAMAKPKVPPVDTGAAQGGGNGDSPPTPDAAPGVDEDDLPF